MNELPRPLRGQFVHSLPRRSEVDSFIRDGGPTLRWLVQSTADHPGLPQAVPPAGLLAPAELARFESFRVPKRRRDWLLGRWTAKRLVQSYLAETRDPPPPLDAIVIDADPDGAPYASLGPDRLPISLSISHSAGHSLCALTDLPGAAVGADLELVEPRPDSLVRQFFVDEEIAAVARAEPAERHRLITLLWSGKEAVLKALREGLRVDTRQVRCRFDQPGAAGEWQEGEVWVDPTLLKDDSRIALWHRSYESFVLTLSLTSSTSRLV